VKSEFKINNFDLLRIFAASQVMLCHGVLHLNLSAPQWLLKLAYAFPGVPIFFVISGFLISASFERSSSLASYYRNRVLRIYPGLWCCLFATVLVASFCGVSFFNLQAPVWLVGQMAGAIYTPGFLKQFGMGSYNGSLWTIPVELQFYLILPALYWLIHSITTATKERAQYFWLFWLVFVAIALAASSAFPPLGGQENEPASQKLFRYSFLPHFFLFMTGIVLQRLKAHESKWVAGKGLCWLIVYLGLYYGVSDAPGAYVPLALLLAVTSVSMAYTAPRTAHQMLRGNDISYGVYIYHGLLINLFVEIGLSGRPESLMLLAGSTYIAGYASWVLVEKRFLGKKRQTIAPSPIVAKQHRTWRAVFHLIRKA
jgi:peptidoglycan/LPS O-acetylase OafA/YrhL